MKICTPLKNGVAAIAVAASTLLPISAQAQSVQPGWEPGKWQFDFTLYGYLPSIGGKLTVPVETGGTNINVDAHQIIDALKMVFMGAFDAHYGRWGIWNDVLYLNVGGAKSRTRDFSIGNIGIPANTTADLNLDLKGIVWTVAGEYRTVSDPAWNVDVLAGARYFGIKPTLGWSINGDLGPIGIPGRSGSTEIKETIWDGIIGVKGRYAFGNNREWFVPFYLDIGTGQSDLTWQGMTGIGYAFSWGNVLAAWRYLDYNFKSGKKLEEMNFNGPLIGVTFRW